MPAFGGSPRKLTDFGSRPTWSPDGQRIAFQSEPLEDLGSNSITLPPSTLWICPLDGGPPHPLTTVDNPPGGHGDPAWSPKGDRIAFVASDHNLSKLWTVSLEGELEQVPNAGFSRESGFAQRLYDVVYAPSGDELYFTGDGDGFYGLWNVSLVSLTVDGSEPRLVIKRVSPSPAIRYPSFSGDGKTLVYASVVMSSNFASVSLSRETHEPTEPPRQLTHYTNARNYFPQFSPDGRTIAFDRAVTGAAHDVWLIDDDGANARRLTTHPGPDRVSRWSSDGQRVIFFSRREGRGGYWTIDVDSREVAFLHSFASHWVWAALSPDLTRVAFQSRKNGGIDNVWLANTTKDGEERQLTFDDEMMAYPNWSPDGELIAFEVKRGLDVEIGVIPAEGGTPVQLTSAPGLNFTGAWSPDGDKIAFASLRDDVWNLRWVSRTDKSECQLTDYTTLNTFVRYPTWSPLGDQIVYEYAEMTGDLWMLELPQDYQR